MGYFSQIIEEDGSPFYKINDSLEARPITAKLRPYLICNSRNPLARMQKTVSTARLAKIPLIDYRIYDDAPSFGATLLEVMGAEIEKFKFIATDIRTLQELIENDMGMCIGYYSEASKVSPSASGIPIDTPIRIESQLVSPAEIKSEATTALLGFLIEWWDENLNKYQG